MKLQLIGGGKMGEALLAGLVASGWAVPEELAVVEPVEGRRAELAERHPGTRLHAEPVDVADNLLAVKPSHVPIACRALRDAARPQRLLSIAAGVTTAVLESQIGPGVAIVRAMPNTAALVGAGAAAIAAGPHAGDAELAWAEGILASVGVAVRTEEELLDAVTGLSGSGPAYVFLVAEALVEGGVLNGLPRPTAELLAIQTIVGAGKLLERRERSHAELRADVTSPGGTTAAGLHELEDRAVRAAFAAAVTAATKRSRELGQSG